RVTPCSPAVDAGRNADVTQLTDQDDNPRIQNGIVDLGPYEIDRSSGGLVFFVDSSAVLGANNGTSWTDAYLRLSDALDPSCLLPGDTIYVARGTYFPDITGLTDPRSASFAIRDSNVLIGGFAPDIGVDSLHERDPFTYEAIMSGDIGVKGDTIDNVYHIIQNNDVDLTFGTVIDGFVLKGGNANSTFPDNRGSAIFCDRDSLMILRCQFEFNFQGAIENRDDGFLKVAESSFSNNISSESAGAIANVRGSRIEVGSSTFIQNGGRFGGAMQNSSSILKVTNSTFDQNEARFGGGAVQSGGTGKDSIVQCLFYRNAARTEGSAVLLGSDTIVLAQSTFFDNVDNEGSIGGALRVSGGADTATIVNNIVYGNKAQSQTPGPAENFRIQAITTTVANNLIGELFEFNGSYPIGGAGTDGGGNIDADPLFRDTLLYDLRLSCLSPAIDSGAASLSGLCIPNTDFRDSARVVGKRIDIGAFEAAGPCPNIAVTDITFGEVCDTIIRTSVLSSIGLGGVVIDTIVSNSTLFELDLSGFTFPDTIDYCDTRTLSVEFVPTESGMYSSTIAIKSNALGGDTIINVSGTLDDTPPMLTCRDTTVYLDASGHFVLDTSFVLASVSDNCEVDTVFLSRDTVRCMDLSTPATIVITARDAVGNESTCISTVQVLDTIPPTPRCKEANVYLNADGTATLTAEQVDNGSTDTCSAVTLNIDSTSFDCAELGENVVTLFVQDAFGNRDSCRATVNVLDTIAPTVRCKRDTLYLDANGMATLQASNIDDGSSDNCAVMTRTLSRTDYTCMDIGTNLVTLRVSDSSDNIDSCTTTVVVLDTISPMAICQSDTIYVDATGEAILVISDLDGGSTDNCGSITYPVERDTFGCDDIGVQVVALLVADPSDNTDMCSATVTILDTLPPIVRCKNAVITLGSNGEATLQPSQVDGGSSDVCSTVELSLDQTLFTCADVGNVSVTLTARDTFGNSSSCQATVTVLENTDANDISIRGPQVLCPNLTNVTFELDELPGATYTWSYSGTGLTINDNGSRIINADIGTLSPGDLTVTISNACGTEIGSESLSLTVGNETFCELATCLRERSFVDDAIIQSLNTIDVFKANGIIESRALIPSDRYIIFKAGNSVDLYPPFEVSAGASFIAEIESCSSSIQTQSHD
ncbi:MAG: choice-of-anchor Q domain-containing protein, partial [Bacteroidota bacterium]